MSCDDLRVGGTLTAAGITGGLSINSTSIGVRDWARLLGSPGISAAPLEVLGRPGMFLAGDRLGRARFLTLDITVTPWGPTRFSLTEPTKAEQVWENTDDFLTEITEPETLLEVDLPDGTKRWLRVSNIDEGLSVAHRVLRDFSIPLVSDWPYWRAGGQEEEDTVNGVDVITVGGRKAVYDAVLEFVGDGTLTHDDLGWAIEVTGSGGAVTVDLGARTVEEGGAAARNRIRRTPAPGAGRVWGWLTPGDNNVTSDVAVAIRRRGQYV